MKETFGPLHTVSSKSTFSRTVLETLLDSDYLLAFLVFGRISRVLQILDLKIELNTLSVLQFSSIPCVAIGSLGLVC